MILWASTWTILPSFRDHIWIWFWWIGLYTYKMCLWLDQNNNMKALPPPPRLRDAVMSFCYDPWGKPPLKRGHEYRIFICNSLYWFFRSLFPLYLQHFGHYILNPCIQNKCLISGSWTSFPTSKYFFNSTFLIVAH